MRRARPGRTRPSPDGRDENSREARIDSWSLASIAFRPPRVPKLPLEGLALHVEQAGCGADVPTSYGDGVLHDIELRALYTWVVDCPRVARSFRGWSSVVSSLAAAACIAMIACNGGTGSGAGGLTGCAETLEESCGGTCATSMWPCAPVPAAYLCDGFEVIQTAQPNYDMSNMFTSYYDGETGLLVAVVEEYDGRSSCIAGPRNFVAPANCGSVMPVCDGGM